MTPSPKKWSHSPNFFHQFSSKKLLFSKKLLNEKILNTSFPIKKVIFIFVVRHFLLLETWAPKMVFSRFLRKCLRPYKSRLVSQCKGRYRSVKASTHLRTNWFAMDTSTPIPFVFAIPNSHCVCAKNWQFANARWCSADLQSHPHLCAHLVHKLFAKCLVGMRVLGLT